MTQTKNGSRFVHAVALCVVSGLILFIGWAYAGTGRAERAYTPDNLTRITQESVPVDKDNVVRLHIKGNSDLGPDQAVKEKVRDALMERFGDLLEGVPNAEEACRVLKGAVPEIETVATACLRENGFSYGATAAVKTDYFPDKQYELADGRIIYLPAGQYTALVVNLGKAEGDNWWCLMYPPLCYLDLVQRAVILKGAQAGAAPSKDGTGTVKPETVAVLVDELRAKDVPVEVRSLLLDALKSGITKLSDFLTRAWAEAEKALAGSQGK